MTTPTQMNVVRIRGGRGSYEWATICWQGWQDVGIDKQPREIGEILINSSFGSWSYQWSHLGVPFAQWLPDAEREYVAGKFLGTKASEFDGEATVKDLRQSLLERRREGDIIKDDARAIWDFIEDHSDDMERSGEIFIERMYDCMRIADWPPRNGRYSDAGPERGARYFLEEPWERIRTRLNHQFAAFWRDLWPVFINHINTTKP